MEFQFKAAWRIGGRFLFREVGISPGCGGGMRRQDMESVLVMRDGIWRVRRPCGRPSTPGTVYSMVSVSVSVSMLETSATPVPVVNSPSMSARSVDRRRENSANAESWNPPEIW